MPAIVLFAGMARSYAQECRVGTFHAHANSHIAHRVGKR